MTSFGLSLGQKNERDQLKAEEPKRIVEDLPCRCISTRRNPLLSRVELLEAATLRGPVVIFLRGCEIMHEFSVQLNGTERKKADVQKALDRAMRLSPLPERHHERRS